MKRDRELNRYFPLFLGIALLFGYGPCISPPECLSDGDCIEDFGPNFICYQHQCKPQTEKNTAEKSGREPQTDGEEPDAGIEQKSEKKALPEEPTGEPDNPQPDAKPTVKRRGVFEICETNPYGPEEKRCEKGLRCYHYTNRKSVCIQDCKANPTVCNLNKERKHCIQIGWENRYRPVPVYTCVKFAKKGDPCEPIIGILCDKRSRPYLVCKKGICVEGKLCQKEGCPCGKNTDPPVECDVSKQLFCHPQTQKCVKGILSKEGEPCGLFGPTNSAVQRICPPGFSCVRLLSSPKTAPSICLKTCSTSNPIGTCTDPTAEDATPLYCSKTRSYSRNPVCIQDSCSTKYCSFNYPHRCLVENPSAKKEFCVPLPQEGPVGYGGKCSTIDPAKFCKHPFMCLPVQGTTGFCTLECKYGDHKLCEIYDPRSKCTLINKITQIRYCGWNCTPCPDNMVCTRNKFCIPK